MSTEPKRVHIGLSGGNGLMLRAYARLTQGGMAWEPVGVWRSSIQAALESLVEEMGDRFLKLVRRFDELEEQSKLVRGERDRFAELYETAHGEVNALLMRISELEAAKGPGHAELRTCAKEERERFADDLIRIVENLRES